MKYSKKIALITIIISAFVIIGTANAEVTKSSAEDLVLNQILADDIGSVDVYSRSSAITSQDSLVMYNNEESSIVPPFNENWVFFINDMPAAMWHHHCRYIFVDKATGDYNILDKNIYPEDLINDFELISQTPIPEVLEIPENPEPISYREPNEHLYAVIICQHDGWDHRDWNSMSGIYCALLEEYGYTKDNIFVHFGNDGNSVFSNDLDGGDYSDDIDYCAQEWRVKRTLHNLSGEETNDPNVPELNTDDQLFFYNHTGGYVSGGHAIINLPGSGNLWDTELRDCVHSINCAQMIFMLGQSYSGGFVDELANQNNPLCTNRAIYTSCGDDEPSWYEQHITGGRYGEFEFYWTAAVRDYYPAIYGSGSNIEIHTWQHGSRTGQFDFSPYSSTMYGNPIDTDPDTNYDCFTQTEEAFYYANNRDTWSPVGYYCPYTGYEDETEHPTGICDVDFIGDPLSLAGICGELSTSQSLIGGEYMINPRLRICSGDQLLLINSTLHVVGEIHLSGELTLDGSLLNVCDGILGIGTWGNYSGLLTVDDYSSVILDGEMNLSSGSLVKIKNGSNINANSGSIITGSKPTTWYDPATGNTTTYPTHAGAEVQISGDRIIVSGEDSYIDLTGTEVNPITISSSSDYQWEGIKYYDSNSLGSGPQYLPENQIQHCNISGIESIHCKNSIVALSRCNCYNTSLNLYSSKLVGTLCTTGSITGYESELNLSDYTINNGNSCGINLKYPAEYSSAILGCMIQGNASRGINCYNSNILIWNSEISNNSTFGIVSMDNSNIHIDNTEISNNGKSEIIADYTSFPLLYYQGYWENNTVIDENYEQGTWDQYLLACSNYENPPIECGDLNIDTSDESRFFPDIDAYHFNGVLSPAKEMFYDGLCLIYDLDFDQAIVTMKNVVSEFPESKAAEEAINALAYIEKYGEKNYSELRDYLESIDVELYPHLNMPVYKAKTASYMHEKDYETAINRLEEIINNPPSDIDSLFAFIDEGYCYLQLEEQGNRANIENCSFRPRSFEQFESVSKDLEEQILNIEFGTFIDGEDHSDDQLASVPLIKGNYPNPFNYSTRISFSIPDKSKIELSVYNIKGQKVKSLAHDSFDGGNHSVIWNGNDDSNKSVGSGIYFYKLKVNGLSKQVRKCILMK